jgi:hypothetical protein
MEEGGLMVFPGDSIAVTGNIDKSDSYEGLMAGKLVS